MPSSIPSIPPSNGPAYTDEVKAKFDKLFPKYGALWKSMAKARKLSDEKCNAQECNDCAGSVDAKVPVSNDKSITHDGHDKENAGPNINVGAEDIARKSAKSSESSEASEESTFSPSKLSTNNKHYSASNHSIENNSINSTYPPQSNNADKANNLSQSGKNPIESPISTPLSSSSSNHPSIISPQFLSPLVLSILSTAKKTKPSHSKNNNTSQQIHDWQREEEDDEDDEGSEAEDDRALSISNGAKNLAEAFEELSLGGGLNHDNVVSNDESENIEGGEVSNSSEEDVSKKEREPLSLLSAIFNKTSVSLRVPSKDHEDICGEECDCADPILEVDEDAGSNGNVDSGVRDDQIDGEDDETIKSSDTEIQAGGDDTQKKDAEHFADTDNKDHDGDAAKWRGRLLVATDVEKTGSVGENHVEVGQDETLLEDHYSFDTDTLQDDDMVLTNHRRNKNKVKAFILDSDDEDELSENDRESENTKDENCTSSGESEAESTSIRSEESDNEVEEVSSRSYDSEKENGNPISPYISSHSDESIDIENESAHSVDESSNSASSEEEEWIELSSDEEDNAEAVKERERRAKRAEAIIILSSDEEESESDYNDHEEGAFFISGDSNSDNSDTSIRGKTKKNTPSIKPPSLKGKPSTKTISPNLTNFTIPKKTRKAPMSKLTDAKSKKSFRKHRESITQHTFRDFDTRAFRNALSSVTVTWSNKLNTTAGITRMKGRLGTEHASSRVATIELATKVIDNEERLRSTLLHEMCHAAMWLVDGVHKPPHGKCFKKWANISMAKIQDVEVTTTHDYQIAYKFAWSCTASNCNVIIKRHSRSVDPARHCCGRCKSKLIEIEVPGSKGDTAKLGYTPKQQKETSGFALFVKNQSSEVRKRLARERQCGPNEVAQADVMKECGKLWRERKTA
mmetsp:Transcript_3888/g.7882  ORF Transcript_3888/g.7882 Transcript_3888/m.7882 type:complete len:915 (-) Transcript_3888:14-2758(-)